MSHEGSVRRKCDSCGQWNEGRPKYCIHCNDYLDHHIKREEAAQRRKAVAEAQAKVDFEAKSPTMKVLIRIGNLFEAVYLGIVGFIAWLLFWLGG